MSVERKELLLNKTKFGFSQIRALEKIIDDEYGCELRFTVADLKEPLLTVWFGSESECEEWFARLTVALDLR
jgi:hypothetical protein